MGLKKRAYSLKIVFLEYLAAMAVMLVLALMIPFAVFLAGIRAGICSEADLGERQAKEAKPVIAAAEQFDSRQVPPSCTYIFLSENKQILKSNMNQEEKENAVLFAGGSAATGAPEEGYLKINRKDGICILHYHIRSEYNIDWMRQYLPEADRLMELLFILNALAGCFLVTALFARRLIRQLQPVMDSAEKIKEKDLDFEVASSSILEFNNILLSIAEMKTELKNSLEQQWRTEQEKKVQISALAHDIKTPVTIIRGNAELLKDSELSDRQKEFLLYIIHNSDRMEQYLKVLLQMTAADAGYLLHAEKTDMRTFLDELQSQMKALACKKEIRTEFAENDLPSEAVFDSMLIQRAVMNIFSNAVDYTPCRSTIFFSVSADQQQLHFCVTDCGSGFSQEDLKNAAARFYQGDASRSSRTHYGMGLFIADSAVRQHGGILSLANSPVTGGGMVSFDLDLK